MDILFKSKIDELQHNLEYKVNENIHIINEHSNIINKLKEEIFYKDNKIIELESQISNLTKELNNKNPYDKNIQELKNKL